VPAATSSPLSATPPTVLPTRWWPWFGGAFLATLVLDLVSKEVLFGLPADTAFPSWIHLVENRGVAWSLLADHPWLVLGLTLLLIPVLGIVWWTSYRREGLGANLAFGMVLGGAVGNATDRVGMHLGTVGGVRDFINIDLGFRPFDPWPTFNIADSGICVGFALILLLPLFTRKA